MSEDGPALLVVDDNEDNRYTLTRRLRCQGYENITEAVNGREAIDVLEGDDFDLVLLDIMMPEMNGYEVLEHVKSDMKLRDQEAVYLERLEAEQKRSDELLHAILPEGAVSELKATNAVQPRRYDDVAVLFCDIVGFTAYCDQTPPEKVVTELQDLVQAFEDIAIEHEMEKIKTIGDAFFSTAGLLRKIDSPVLAATRCALAMVAVSGTLEPGWQVRVGIHYGPVVAGIVGRRQFMFDLWGDTVNVAARIVNEAGPGSVYLSSDAWMQVRNQASGKSRGMSDLKGKGDVELVEVTAAK